MGPEGGGRAAPRTSSLDGLGPFPTWSEPCLSCLPAPSHGSRQRPVRGRGARRVPCAPAATPRPGRPRPVLPLTELPGLEGNGELAGQGLAEETPHRPPKAASVRGPGCVSLRWTGPSARLAGGGRAGPESAKNPASDLTRTRVCVHPNTPTPPAETGPDHCVFGGGSDGWHPGTQGRGTVSGREDNGPGSGRTGPRTRGRIEPPSTPVPSASVPSPGPSRGRAPRQPSVPLSPDWQLYLPSLCEPVPATPAVPGLAQGSRTPCPAGCASRAASRFRRRTGICLPLGKG